ncbi:MAG TPA: DUF6044 family protein, partial [Bacillales bacterium]|nr:DUF6044 family protein [Bacillales bacterium]
MTFLKQQIWIILAIALILLYLSPLFILGQNSHVRIHDQLDSTVVWYKILADSGKLFASNQTTIPNLMNGLPRVSLGSQFKLLVWLFVLFPPFAAYTINAAVLRFVAFFGMYFLLKKHVLKDQNEPYILAGVSLCFALLPFWLPGCLSIAGIPLASYLFLNIRNHKGRWLDWLLIALLPFASSFILTFLFFLWIIALIWLIDWIRTKQSNWPLFWAAAMMTGIFLAKDYRLVQSVLLGQGFIPHRIEFNRGHSSLPHALQNFLGYFTGGQTHSYTLQYEVIIYIAGALFLW